MSNTIREKIEEVLFEPNMSVSMVDRIETLLKSEIDKAIEFMIIDRFGRGTPDEMKEAIEEYYQKLIKSNN